MARLLGVEIPNEKKIEYSLPYIYGIGLSVSRKILAATNIDPNIRAGELSDEQIAAITQTVQGMKIPIEGDLRRELQMHISASLVSTATVPIVIVVVCQCAASVPTPTPALARVHVRPWVPKRRSNLNSSNAPFQYHG